MRTSTQSGLLALACLALVLLASDGHAQRFYGLSIDQGLLFENVPYPGGDCSSPWPFTMVCDYTTPACGVPPLLAGISDPYLGDVAVDRIKDTVYVTDGFVIYEFVGDTPCGSPPPCTPLNAFELPGGLGMGPLTGLGMDPAGTITSGTPTLWITDGEFIAGLEPGPCSATVLVAPCAPSGLTAGAKLTDISWNTGTAFGPGLYACDDKGFVYHINMPGCSVDWTHLVWLSNPCFFNLNEPLTGIAFDVTTPNCITGQPDTLLVTQGYGLAPIKVPGPGYELSFHVANECSTGVFFAWTTGLAMSLHGIEYGGGFVEDLSVETYGSTTSPSTTFGFEILDPPADTNTFLVLNFNTTSPNGYLCPEGTVISKDLWVNPFASVFVVLGDLDSAPCTMLPAAIPGGICEGFQVYAQAFAVPYSGPPALEASLGAAFTIGAP